MNDVSGKTHWSECWRVHHECAKYEIEILRKEIEAWQAAYAKLAIELEKEKMKCQKNKTQSG
jgi:hypothetical protein